MAGPADFLLDDATRRALWTHLNHVVEDYLGRVSKARVAPDLDPARIRALLEPLDFTQPLDPLEAVDLVARGLWDHQVHTPHPRYFGLFNPAPTTMGIAADTLVAAFNPQLAAWSHNPFANEIERHLIRAFGERFGYDLAQADGTFTSGGAEANHTALLTALVHTFPAFATGGLRALDAQPVFYVSAQSHHSFIKAARFCGLGTDAVRQVPVNARFQMDVDRLAELIAADRQAGFAPFMVVATAGTTGAGVVDPVADTGAVAAREGLWYHVDAAWGGAAVFVPELRPLLHGVEQADSITFDAHKWLSVPMAAGICLTCHPDILSQTCRMTTDYMPRDAADLDIVDPYTHSMQWSRRFIGLKVFLSLLVAGWDGYAAVIRHQVAMGHLLRRELETSGWRVKNQTDLAVICFVDQDNETEGYLTAITREVVTSGQAWLSTTRLDDHTFVLRACITNYRTGPDDVRALVQALNAARQRVRTGS
jgi:glutamate/tyrosine decarboxylase-like PLP-dependent enzyme